MTRFFENRMTSVAVAWTIVFALACIPRLLVPSTPITSGEEFLLLIAPYAVIVCAPLMGYYLASRSFPRGQLSAQPSLRLALYGRWNPIGIIEARRSTAFGPAGFMASLLIGLLLNVVMRSFEFLLAIPAMGGTAPEWGNRLFALMAGDVVVMSFFYMVCFVMALRTIPLFPRMLLFAWATDITIQLLIGRAVMATPGVPATVAGSLHDLLAGNISKVLISAFVWLPYLILSDRVNVTYRRRVRAS